MLDGLDDLLGDEVGLEDVRGLRRLRPLEHPGADVAGAHDRDVHVVVPDQVQLGADRLGKADHGPLARSVGRSVGQTDQTRRAGDVDQVRLGRETRSGRNACVTATTPNVLTA